MAISEEIVTSLVEAVAALNQRTNDAMSRAMIAGPQGAAGPQGERGEDAPPVSDEQVKAAAVAWLEENITQAIDGLDGKDGEQGPQGRPPTDEEIQLAVNIWFEINRASLIGPAGSNGSDGADGRDGRNGVDGRNGSDGVAGPAGVGIALVDQRDERSFWITLTDGQEFQIELPVAKASSFFGGGGGGGSNLETVVNISADTVLTKDYTFINATNSITLTIPTAGFTVGFSVNIRNAGTGQITILGNINGNDSIILGERNSVIGLLYTGSGWVIF